MTSRARCKKEKQSTVSSCDVQRRLHAAVNTTAEPKERAVSRGHLSLLNKPRPPYLRRLLEEDIRRRPQLPRLLLTIVHPKQVKDESWSVRVYVRLQVEGKWQVDTSVTEALHL